MHVHTHMHTHTHARTWMGGQVGAKCVGDSWACSLAPHSLFLVTLVQTLSPPNPPFPSHHQRLCPYRGHLPQPLAPWPPCLLLCVPGFLTHSQPHPTLLARLHLSLSPTALESLCLFSHPFPSWHRPPPSPSSHTHTCPSLSLTLLSELPLLPLVLFTPHQPFRPLPSPGSWT